jgi:hypothetical protein
MPSLQERQAPIDAAIVNAMIESTPETWQQIVLTLERAKGKIGIGDFTHELSSPEGHAPVRSADSLFEATYQLDELLQSNGGGLSSKAVYVAKFIDGSWSYQAEFEYA